jgi:cysteinyl-tRNA synthetase
MAGKSAPRYAYGEYTPGVAPDSCPATNPEVKAVCEGVYDALCDDLNTPTALSHIFDAIRIINTAKDKKVKLSKGDIDTLVQLFDDIVFGVLGLQDEEESGKAMKTISGLMDMVLESRAAAKAAKDWTTSDHIREALATLGIKVKDTQDGAEWTLE